MLSILSSVPCPPPYPSEVFDRILLDGPCSALGQRPQACYQLSLKELCSYQPYQRKLFKQVQLSKYTQWSLEPSDFVLFSTIRLAFIWLGTKWAIGVVRFFSKVCVYPGSLFVEARRSNGLLYLQHFSRRE